ncbi:MAG: 1-deoxy-D-xylulose 5-phosphate reductoisomerase [Desulfatitalea sp. BRH_c12]|nr:MAG: 1-deoxy-D-xylulose 5-phosphate reductoisomerase [Desulfatitalea sp. BRH_c12]
MKSLSVLGATGSIGRNTLRIAARFPDRFKIIALTAKNNVERLAEQIETFAPRVAVVYDENAARRLKTLLAPRTKIEILHGPDGYRAAAVQEGVDMVVGAMVGASGLAPTLAAIEAGKDIALANKETLVMAGAIVMAAVARKGVRLLPVDSEHSAIFQCLQGQQVQELDRILLTASGGPFLNTPAEQFAALGPDQALRHPNWQMGAKISIDSATLMNKGLEVIEAKWLFDLTPDQIDIVVHPQSIVHSMVAFCDGSIIAQLGIPDMQGAIAYALSYPQRLPLQQPLPDLAGLGALTFAHPDVQRFHCLTLAFQACREGGSMPAVLNAANEVAVEAFLSRQLTFLGIAEVVQGTMAAHHSNAAPDLDVILAADAWARQTATDMIASRKAE